MGRPSGATLFPYTTLFRSWSDVGEERRREGVLKVLRPGVKAKLAEELDILAAVARFLDERSGSYDLPPFEYRDTFEDRKSTRLNSSHRCISYAVFCLKKNI